MPEPVPEAAGVPPTLTIDAVEIATAETLTDSLLAYLRSYALPQGQVTIDITIEGGKVAVVGVEGGDSTLWSQLLQNWTPPEETGRVRLQIAVP